MTKIPATAARQRWAETIEAAHKEPVIITEHGRETVMILDFEMAQRALRALEDAQDLAAAREAEAAIAEGEQTVPLEELARELGLRLG